MHGFYEAGPNDQDGLAETNERLNVGIAVVPLIDQVIDDLVQRPDQVRVRQQLLEGRS